MAGRHDHHAAARGGAHDHIGKRVRAAIVAMGSIAIGRLDHQHVAGLDDRRRLHQQVVGTADVAGEQQRTPPAADFQRASAEDVAGMAQPQLQAAKVERPVERQRLEVAQGLPRVILGVQRQCRVVLRGLVPVRKGGIVFLQVAAIGQQQFAQCDRGRRGPHAAAKSLPHQQRQRARMVEVRMGQDHGIQARRIDRQGLPVQQAQVLVALEQPAIDQQPAARMFEQVFRSGHGAGCAKEGKLHRMLCPIH